MVRASHAHPLAGLLGTFYQNTSGFATLPTANIPCYGGYECFNQAQEPNLLSLVNSTIAVSYSLLANATGTCPAGQPNPAGNTTVRVAYSTSTNGAQTFSAPTFFPLSCPYVQQLEPSFAVSSSGSIYGTYVEANATSANVLGFGATPVSAYTARPSDALAFVTSTDNATSFSAPRVIAVAGSANIARPSLAAFGSTVYIAYENISNGTGTLPGTSPLISPISVQFVYSSNSGATWNGPYTLPGLNATQYYNSISPSVAVSNTGTVGVGYATDRHCIAYCAGAPFYQEYGDDLVMSTSASNGTSWSGPHVVAHDVGNGESTNYNGNYNYYGSASLFEEAPLTAVAYNPVSSSWDFVWVGAINLTMDNIYDQWYSTQVFAATSSNGGVSWSYTTVGHGLPNDQNTYAVGYLNPGVSISPTGEEYVSVGWYNETGQSCGVSGANYYSSGYTQWTTTSPDGIHFSDLISSTVAENDGGYAQYFGYRSSVAFNKTGGPLTGYALPAGYSYSFPYSFYPGQLDIARPYSGPTVTVQGIDNSLGLGGSWTFYIDGNSFTSNTRSINVTNVPAAAQVVVIQGTPGLRPIGFWTAIETTQSGPQANVLASDSTYWFNATKVYGLNFNVEPLNIGYFQVEIFNYSASPSEFCYHYWESGSYPAYFYTGGTAFPWYFPAGEHIALSTAYSYPVGATYYSNLGIYYFNGTGSGSFTGASSTADLVMNGPINETAWAQSDSTFNETVQSPGLPSNSTYSFNWDGTPHSAVGTSPVIVPSVSTGAHWITGVAATSAQAGWKYFGAPALGNPIAVPDTPVVNLTFSYIHLAAAAGTISFHAIGLVAGSLWHLSFNGTEYSSATPWINVTGHPGNYPVRSYPVVASDGSAGYAPKAFGPRLNVTTGGIYPVTFSSAYALSVSAAAGGRIVPGPSTSWLLPGTHASYNASANPGYRFLGWSGVGNGSFTGTTTQANVTVNGPIQESANFAPLPGNRFNITFTQSAIPAGTWWTVYVGGVGYSSDTGSLTVHNLNACSQTRYSLSVPYAYANGTSLARYVPVGVPSSVCSGTVLPVNFGPQYYVNLQSTSGGSVSASTTSNSYTAPFWLSPSSSATFQATPAGSNFRFIGWNGSGAGSFNGSANPRTISVSGPISELAVFGPALPSVTPKYPVTFRETTPFASGTAWSVWLGGSTYSSTGTQLTIPSVAAGQYNVLVQATLSPDGLTQYQPFGAPSHLTVSATTTPVNLTYHTSYWVSISALGGGSTSPHSGWYASGANLGLVATPSGTNLFKAWTGSGSGSYTGSSASTNLTVTAPMSEVATFVPLAPVSTTLTSSWNSPTLWAELAIAGLIVGLIAGIVAMRLRRGGSSPPATEFPASAAPDPASDGSDSGGSP
ncbi:MAG: hypothetical protein L3K19_08610 [Thermoplasmata archaeon]|nr:hypothetical protein [Thermoplasmata archaeon]